MDSGMPVEVMASIIGSLSCQLFQELDDADRKRFLTGFISHALEHITDDKKSWMLSVDTNQDGKFNNVVSVEINETGSKKDVEDILSKITGRA